MMVTSVMPAGSASQLQEADGNPAGTRLVIRCWLKDTGYIQFIDPETVLALARGKRTWSSICCRKPGRFRQAW